MTTINTRRDAASAENPQQTSPRGARDQNNKNDDVPVDTFIDLPSKSTIRQRARDATTAAVAKDVEAALGNFAGKRVAAKDVGQALGSYFRKASGPITAGIFNAFRDQLLPALFDRDAAAIAAVKIGISSGLAGLATKSSAPQAPVSVATLAASIDDFIANNALMTLPISLLSALAGAKEGKNVSGLPAAFRSAGVKIGEQLARVVVEFCQSEPNGIAPIIVPGQALDAALLRASWRAAAGNTSLEQRIIDNVPNAFDEDLTGLGITLTSLQYAANRRRIAPEFLLKPLVAELKDTPDKLVQFFVERPQEDQNIILPATTEALSGDADRLLNICRGVKQKAIARNDLFNTTVRAVVTDPVKLQSFAEAWKSLGAPAPADSLFLGDDQAFVAVCRALAAERVTITAPTLKRLCEIWRKDGQALKTFYLGYVRNGAVPPDLLEVTLVGALRAKDTTIAELKVIIDEVNRTLVFPRTRLAEALREAERSDVDAFLSSVVDKLNNGKKPNTSDVQLLIAKITNDAARLQILGNAFARRRQSVPDELVSALAKLDVARSLELLALMSTTTTTAGGASVARVIVNAWSKNAANLLLLLESSLQADDLAIAALAEAQKGQAIALRDSIDKLRSNDKITRSLDLSPLVANWLRTGPTKDACIELAGLLLERFANVPQVLLNTLLTRSDRDAIATELRALYAREGVFLPVALDDSRNPVTVAPAAANGTETPAPFNNVLSVEDRAFLLDAIDELNIGRLTPVPVGIDPIAIFLADRLRQSPESTKYLTLDLLLTSGGALASAVLTRAQDSFSSTYICDTISELLLDGINISAAAEDLLLRSWDTTGSRFEIIDAYLRRGVRPKSDALCDNFVEYALRFRTRFRDLSYPSSDLQRRILEAERRGERLGVAQQVIRSAGAWGRLDPVQIESVSSSLYGREERRTVLEEVAARRKSLGRGAALKKQVLVEARYIASSYAKLLELAKDEQAVFKKVSSGTLDAFLKLTIFGVDAFVQDVAAGTTGLPFKSLADLGRRFIADTAYGVYFLTGIVRTAKERLALGRPLPDNFEEFLSREVTAPETLASLALSYLQADIDPQVKSLLLKLRKITRQRAGETGDDDPFRSAISSQLRRGKTPALALPFLEAYQFGGYSSFSLRD